jgi:Icc-related predicted phosphoesterase
MKIQIKSDLHKETRPGSYRVSNANHKSIMNPEADLLIIAGDITNYPDRFALHHELTRLDKPVIYVPGNHEYYRAESVNLVLPELTAMYEGTNVSFLNNSTIRIGYIQFICSTLWSDLSRPMDAILVSNALADFRVPGLNVNWYRNEYSNSKKFVENSLKKFNKTTKIVVTHHSPSPLSIAERFKGDALNAGFSSDLTDLIRKHGPDVWIHGHTHDVFDYKISNTRVICNPKGYINEHGDASKFNDDLIIEV